MTTQTNQDPLVIAAVEAYKASHPTLYTLLEECVRKGATRSQLTAVAQRAVSKYNSTHAFDPANPRRGELTLAATEVVIDYLYGACA